MCSLLEKSKDKLALITNTIIWPPLAPVHIHSLYFPHAIPGAQFNCMLLPEFLATTTSRRGTQEDESSIQGWAVEKQEKCSV